MGGGMSEPTRRKPKLSYLQARLQVQRMSPQRQEAVVAQIVGKPPNRAARRAKSKFQPPSRRYRPNEHLGDGVVGYYADTTRQDDCFRAAIATATQIPIEQVPDLRLHDRLLMGDDPDEINADAWAKIAGWLDGRGLPLVQHEIVPVDRERWIGVCVVVDDEDIGPTEHKRGTEVEHRPVGVGAKGGS